MDKSRMEAQDLTCELLAWLVFTYPRGGAAWAAEVGRLLDGFALFRKGQWQAECEQWAKERGRAFEEPNPLSSDEEDPPSSFAL
jgi:hypothetical protein